MRYFFLPIVLVLISLRSSLAAEPPRVVTSIKPVHSLVASIMKGLGEPELLIAGEADPHNFTLKPSQARVLEQADLVFWIGPAMEEFLTGPLKSIGADAVSVTLFGDSDEHGDENPHIWLDPVLMKKAVQKVVAAFGKADFKNVKTYETNAKRLLTRMDSLSANAESVFFQMKKSGFLTWHNAFEHFEKRYGLTSSGSITQHEEVKPGAARIRELQAHVKSGDVTCILSEPHANQKLIDTLTENSGVKVVSVDPSGSTLEAGPDLYFQLLEIVTAAFSECLSSASK